MIDEPKPCPNPECGKSSFCFDVGDIGNGVEGDSIGAWVICQSCGMQGPGGARGQQEAVRLWNLLPRKSDMAEAWHEGGEDYAAGVRNAKNPYLTPRRT